MDAVDLFNACLAQATMVVKQIRPEHMANATPDSDWNVRDLVERMLVELHGIPHILSGEAVAHDDERDETGLIDEAADLSLLWQATADKAERAATDADLEEMAHLNYGDMAMEDYLKQAAADQLIHAWDIGRSIGVPISFDSGVAQQLYDQTLPQRDKLQASGLFASAIAVPHDSNIQIKLLGLFGRSANWRRPANI